MAARAARCARVTPIRSHRSDAGTPDRLLRWPRVCSAAIRAVVRRGMEFSVGTTVAELLGHNGLRMVMRYAHLAPACLSAQVGLLDPAKPKRARKGQSRMPPGWPASYRHVGGVRRNPIAMLSDRLSVSNDQIHDFPPPALSAGWRSLDPCCGEDFGPLSDVDVLVEFEPGQVPGLLRLAAIEPHVRGAGVRGRAFAAVRSRSDLSEQIAVFANQRRPSRSRRSSMSTRSSGSRCLSRYA